MELTAFNVIEIYNDCYCLKEKDSEDIKVKVIEGVFNNHNFKENLINEKKAIIKKMLLQLHKNFLRSTGSLGWKFNDARLTKDGRQWTEATLITDMLVALGIAASIVKFTIPREKWHTLTDEMPYFVIYDN